MIELIHLIFVESPIGLSILLLGIVFIGIMGYRADMQDTFSRRYEQDEKWRKTYKEFYKSISKEQESWKKELMS